MRALSLALALALLFATAPAAVSEGTTASPGVSSSDSGPATLPKHPIPYRLLRHPPKKPKVDKAGAGGARGTTPPKPSSPSTIATPSNKDKPPSPAATSEKAKASVRAAAGAKLAAKAPGKINITPSAKPTAQSADKAAKTSSQTQIKAKAKPKPKAAVLKTGVVAAAAVAAGAVGEVEHQTKTPPPPAAVPASDDTEAPANKTEASASEPGTNGNAEGEPAPSKPPAAAPAVRAAPPSPPPPPPPVRVGPPPPPLAAPIVGAKLKPGMALAPTELEAFVDGQVSEAMAADHAAGVVVAVVQNGQLLMEKGFGVANGSSLPMDPRKTLIRLGSASQLFTWLAVLKASEQGRLSLDDPVNAHLPDDLKIPDEGFAGKVRIRHLMSHTAGFEERALGRLYTQDPDRLVSLETALRRYRPRRVRSAGMVSDPSDYGVALAGEIVARAEGRSFDDLVESEILKPLGLTHTSFREPYAARSDLPEPLSGDLTAALSQGFSFAKGAYQVQPAFYGQSLGPALAASSTADDMARLMIALLNNGRLGEASLLSSSTNALLHTPLDRRAGGMAGWDHGLAEQRLPGGLTGLVDQGSALEFHTAMVIVPQLNLGILVATNTDTGMGLTRRLPEALVGRFYGRSPPHQPSEDDLGNADVGGTYLSARRAYHGLEAFADRLSLSSVVTPEPNGALTVRSGGETVEYFPQGEDRYQAKDGRELFTPEDRGRAQAYLLGSQGGAAERVGGVHSLRVLEFWTALAALAIFASFAGLFIPERSDPRETRAQTTANALQIITCLVWCAAAGAFYLFAKDGFGPRRLMFDWPNKWLVTASWLALSSGILTLAMTAQLPSAWQEGRRINGWTLGRKFRHSGTIAIFLALSAVLAAWGVMEPWSS